MYFGRNTVVSQSLTIFLTYLAFFAVEVPVEDTDAPPARFFPTLLENLRDDMPRMVKVLSTIGTTDDEEYLWWDKLRYKEPPEGLNHEEWWLGLKFKRRANMRQLPLEMIDGEPFAYSLPDKMLRELDYVSQRASGQIALPEEVVSKTSRDRYVIQSLIEEAISSSQLEGGIDDPPRGQADARLWRAT